MRSMRSSLPGCCTTVTVVFLLAAVAATNLIVSCHHFGTTTTTTASSTTAFTAASSRTFVSSIHSIREQQKGKKSSSRQQLIVLAALKDLNVRETSVKGLTKLRFQASTNYATKPLPSSSKSSTQFSLQEFLFREDHRDMILAGSNNKVELLSTPDQGLYELWKDEAMKSPGPQRFAPPVPNVDPILRVTSTGISFPGLALLLVATVGCKQVVREEEDNNTIPELQITLLGNKLQAQGPKPLVWVFNELTGADKADNNNNSIKPRGGSLRRRPQLHLFPSTKNTSSGFTTHSTNLITIEKVKKKNDTDDNDTEEESVIFRSKADIAIDVSFPSFLLNILPVSKTMAEKQGSDAILKVIERDIGPCLEELGREYVRCVNE